MFSTRLRALSVFVVLAAAGSGLLLAQSPQTVGTWVGVGSADNPFGNGAHVDVGDGHTLIVGGTAPDGAATNVVANFDAATNQFAIAGTLLSARTEHTATLLKDGRVLVTAGIAGGLLSTEIELFDPSTGSSTLVAQMAEPRRAHVAALLQNGSVLIAGGYTTGDVVLQTAFIFDPATNAVSPTPGGLSVARASASATSLIDGRVVIVGGTDGTNDLRSAEIFDPTLQSFTTASTQLSVPVHGHSAVLLPNNGSVLIAGGTSNNVAQAGAELFLPAEFPDPFSWGMGQFAPTAAMGAARSSAIAGPTAYEGYSVVTGGGSSNVERYRFATIKTDKDDYAPGEHALITGTGWQPGETVTLNFQEDPAVHEDYVLMLTADGQGNISTSQWAPEQHDLDVRFYLMASGSRSKAQTTFTDGNISSTLSLTITPSSVSPGGTLSWSITAQCVDQNQNQTCASEGFTNGGSVQNGYTIIIEQATTANFNNAVTRVPTMAINGGAAAGSFAAPSSGGPFFYRARHDNQNLPDVPALPVGDTQNSWRPQNSSTVTVTLATPTDNTPPVITPNIAGTLGNNGWYRSNVTVTWTVTDPESAITSQTGCGTTNVTADTASTTITCSATSAGGTSSNSVTIKRDASAPNPPTGTKSPAANGAGWNNSDVTVTFAPAGDVGPSGGVTCSSSVVQSVETASTDLVGSCSDAAGNESSDTAVNVKLDKTAPNSVVGTANRVPDHGTWYTASVGVTFNGLDGLSGIASCSTSTYSGPDGTNVSIGGSCTDRAGNTTPGSFLLNYDTGAPSISGVRDTPANGYGWNNTDVTVSFTCFDATSGLAAGSPPPPAVVSTEGPNQSVTRSCADNAGHTASATVSNINIDKIAPTVSADRSPAANAHGWNNADVIASYSASDALSGLVEPVTGDHLFNTEGAGQSHTFTVNDKAGNSATAFVNNVNIDKTAPDATPSRSPAANANGWNNQDVTVSFTATDALSGIDGAATDSFVFSTEGEGQSHSFTVLDLAGNSRTVSFTDVNIDKIAPSITAQRDTAANVNGWNSTDVVTSYSASDALSGLVEPATGQFTFTSEGTGLTHTFTVSDKAGNTGSATISGINIDKTAPSISGNRSPAANNYGWNNTDVTVSFQCTDATSGLAPGSPPAATIVTAEVTGHSVNGTCTDLAGNSASNTVSGINIDKTAPSITAQRDTAANVNGWNNTDVVTSYSASDALSGLVEPATGQFTFTSEGSGLTHTFTVNDKAGNTGSATISGINIDKTAPSISGNRSPAANSYGWNNTDVTVSFQCTDATSGLAPGSPPAATIVTAEVTGHSVSGTCSDLAGNSASNTVSGINIDKTAPSITASRLTPANANGWNNTDVGTSYSASDALSGLVEPATGGFTFTGESAAQTHTFTVNDKAGNTASATISNVNIDKTAPTATTSRLPAANANGWNNSDVTASFSASDALSGVDGTATGSHIFSNEGANQSHSFTVVDRAGNTLTVSFTAVNIDKTVPSILTSRSPAANANGWNNTDVVASYTASDTLSGLDPPASGSGSYTFTAEGANQQHTFTVSDLAGNTSSGTIANVSIDKTRPVTGITGVVGGSVYILGSVPTPVCGTTDNPSGVITPASLAVTGGVPPGVGQFTATCSGATDRAGNVAYNAVASYTVQFASAANTVCNGAPGHQVLQPINLTGSSLFPKKGGSTVPVKFRVCGVDGVSVGPTPVVASFDLINVLNGATGEEEPAIEATNSDTAFRWSASDAQWIFNLSTKNLQAGRTYVYRITLYGGSTIQFQFGLK